MLNVAILDSGIDKKYIDSSIAGKHHIYMEYGKICIDDNVEDEFGHGTAIFSIISNQINTRAEKRVQFEIIKLFDDEEISEEILCYALEYVYEKLDVDIINMSLGLIMLMEGNRLLNICRKLYEKGTILVAAFDNMGAMSYPAAFDCVLGVTGCAACKKINDFVYFNDTIINIGAKSGLQRVAWISPPYLLITGNSFACAHVTRQVISFMLDGLRELQQIKTSFSDLAVKKISYKSTDVLSPQFKIESASLFPFNKEMHSLFRFRDMLDFEIVDIYDSKISLHIGVSVNKLLNIQDQKDYVIKSINNIEWDTFDTLIIGHLKEYEFYSNNPDMLEKVVKAAIEKGKNVYAFDDLLKEMNMTCSEKLYYPRVDLANALPVREGKLFQINKPVLGVFGTSSKQGKFSLQLELRKRLMLLGYSVGQIGTEPSAYLYNFDFLFPMGFNKSIYVDVQQGIQILNYQLQKICERDKDIILVGSQSGTIPYDFNNLECYTTDQINFLMATQPDAVILCINPYDDPKYILNTINLIESIGNGSKVIAIVVFPMTIDKGWKELYGKKTILSEDEFLISKEKFEKMFEIPVFCLGTENDMEKLVQNIINFF